MAYLDSSNVEELVSDIKDLADDTYASKTSLITTQRMFAPILNNMVAEGDLHEGEFVIVNNAMYRITQDIASGATIVNGTNASRVLDGERKALAVSADNIVCAERTYVTLASLHLRAGTWAIFGTHDFDESKTDAYQDVFFQGSTVLGITRNIPGGSGGGAVTFTLFTVPSGNIIDYKTYGYGTSGTSRNARRIYVCAIQIF